MTCLNSPATASPLGTYYLQRKEREDAIAETFDTQCDLATQQFYRGDHRWAATLEAAIESLGIPQEEVEDLRIRTQARLAEAEAILRQ